MRFHVGDYLADTMHLSTFQHGIYVLLIMHYFKRGGLPKDEAALRRIAKCPLRQWRAESGPVMALFMYENGIARHPRIDAERNEARRLSAVRRNAGISGAKARWGMANANDDAGSDITADDGNCHDGLAGARATPQPTTKSKEPPSSPPASGGKGERAGHNGGGKKNGRFQNAWSAEGDKIIAEKEGNHLDNEPIRRARAISTSRH